jgi:hypothetical protein
MDTKHLQTIHNNLCLQVIALQEQIASRTENTNLPSQQEITTQVRLINSIDKVGKQIARLRREKAAEAKEQAAKRPASDPAPYPDATFRRYTHLLNEHNTARPDDLVPVEGKDVNLQWFIYNLFQFYKPENQRVYIGNVGTFKCAVYMPDVSDEISALLSTRRAA